jgi:hypothetical protein
LALIRDQCDKRAPPLPADVAAALPPEAHELLFSMLAKDPAKRPASARDALLVLERARPSAVGPANAAPPAAPKARRAEVAPDTIEIIERLEKRRTLSWVIGGVLLLLGIGGLALLATRSPEGARAEDGDERAEAPKPVAQVEPARTESDGQVTWRAPVAWRRTPNEERGAVASYALTRAAGDPEDATVVIRTSGSDGNETRARVRSQFDVCGPQCDVLRARDVGGTSVSIIELSGTFWGTSSTGKPRLGFSMLVAVVPFTAESFYEIRLTGPDKTVTAARSDFDALIGSLRRTSPR